MKTRPSNPYWENPPEQLTQRSIVAIRESLALRELVTREVLDEKYQKELNKKNNRKKKGERK